MQENKKKSENKNLKNTKKYTNQRKSTKNKINNQANISKNSSKNINKNSKINANSKSKYNLKTSNNLSDQTNVLKNKKITDNKKNQDNKCQEYYPIKKKKVQTTLKTEVQEIKKKETKIFENSNLKLKKELEIHEQKKSKNILMIIGIIILIILLISGYFAYSKYLDNLEIENQLIEEKQKYENHLETIKNSYNQFVLTKDLYNKDLEIVGLVSKDVELELDIFMNPESEYFKLKNYDLYIKYDSIKKINNLTKEDQRYKNYLPFNLSVITNKDTKLYISNDST